LARAHGIRAGLISSSAVINLGATEETMRPSKPLRIRLGEYKANNRVRFCEKQIQRSQREAKVARNSDSIEDVTKHIDSLIQRGLRRVETTSPDVNITDYIRLLQLSPEMQPDDLLEIIWVDDLENFDLPEAA
jgi:hypothetical protein